MDETAEKEMFRLLRAILAEVNRVSTKLLATSLGGPSQLMRPEDDALAGLKAGWIEEWERTLIAPDLRKESDKYLGRKL